VLAAEDLTVELGGLPVLRGVGLAVGSGEAVALLGGNGSGKSTLVRALLGLTPHQRGSVRLFGAERPLAFYSAIAGLLALASVLLAVPLFVTYAETGLVPRFPTAILSTGLMLLAALAFFAGLILDTVTRGRRELKMLSYLGHPAPE
jgi:ABC-type cobalamin/Fe3+-siderophores transport system ATPase subunit